MSARRESTPAWLTAPSSKATPSSPSYYSDDPNDDAASQYSYSSSAYTADSLPTDRSAFEVRGGFGDWLRARVDEATKQVKQSAESFGRPVIFTPRDGPQPRRRPGARGPIAAIPWRELVGLKESLLTNMEGAAVAAERLDDSAALGGEHAVALQHTVTDLDAAIRELQQVAEADQLETEAIAADLRRQVEQLRGEHDLVQRQAADRRQRELEKSQTGLMGQVAKQHEAKLVVAKERHALAKSRLSVHLTVLSREVKEAEAPEAAVLAAVAASSSGASTTASAVREAAAEEALASTLERLEASFSHVRAPPPMRAPALVARWRRLQLGEPFGLTAAGGSPRRVWVALSADVRTVEIGAAKGAPPTRVVPLAEVVRMNSDARALTLHTIRGERVVLLAADAPMLVFWYAGLQDLASVPPAERTSRGALLWRAARHLWRARCRAKSALDR